jgi:hypothetical protein
MIGIATTNELRNYPADGSIFVGYDGQDYGYWGMTEQANGDVLVHLEYADASAQKHDIEVAKADLDQDYWDL